MPEDTTIRLPMAVRDRLRRYGLKGQSYAEILANLMDQVDHKRFLREQLQRLDEAVERKGSLRNVRDV